MARPPRAPTPLLPSEAVLLKLTPQKIQIVMDVIEHNAAHNARYASLAMVCGTFILLVALSLSTYLTVKGFPKMASAVIGTSVLGIVGDIVRSRLS